MKLKLWKGCCRVKLLILCEKNSARQTFEKALNGRSGVHSIVTPNDEYYLTNASGHLLELADPEDQVSEDKKDYYKTWDLQNIPWDYTDFTWKKIPIRSNNRSTELLNKIKQDARDKDGIVIATDNDPSGEGDVLGWEILEYINWTKKVYRIKFEDSEKSILHGLEHPKEIVNRNTDGAYLKGLSRQRFDYLSMQYSRVAKIKSKEMGYDYGTPKAGRLKSLILGIVGRQWAAINGYVKKPFYEARYKDNSNHEYARKFEEGDTFRHTGKVHAEQEVQNLSDDVPKVLESKRKTARPPLLLDLSGMASLVQKKGYGTDTIEKVYQNMYQDGYVSYPRTADKKFSQVQFDELLPLADEIATVVGVSTALLTHKELRSTHKVEACEHGPNRPGQKVPSSLKELETKYGKVGVEIYTTLAKSFLAILCEDYVYDVRIATLENHPEYISKFNMPVELNFRKFLNPLSEEQLYPRDFGTTASSFVFSGSNKKPSKPNSTFIFKYLIKNDVGTGATRLSTLNDLVRDKRPDGRPLQPMLLVSKGVYSLTPLGQVEYALLSGCFLSNPKATRVLQDAMAEVETNPSEEKLNKIYDIFSEMFSNDFVTMQKNSQNLKDVLGDVKPEALVSSSKDSNTRQIMYEGRSGYYKVTYSQKGRFSHKFTKSEINALEQGKKIMFDVSRKTTTGKSYKQTITGKLAWQKFTNKQGEVIEYLGFKADDSNRKAKDGKFYPRVFRGHEITDADAEILENGRNLTIPVITLNNGEQNSNAVVKLVDGSGKYKKIEIVEWGKRI